MIFALKIHLQRLLFLREDVEDESLVQKSKSKKISLLVYGDALSATTHIQLIQACKKNKTKYQIFHNSSILTAIGETGLSLYKFGKTTSMPRWTETWQPDSFADYIYQNLTIDAHTLLLVDIGLELKKAKQQLEKALTKHKIKTSKILLCSGIGTSEQKIICKGLEKLPNKIEKPYCFVLPASLSDFEKNVLKEI